MSFSPCVNTRSRVVSLEPDEQLVVRVSAGDAEALAVLVRRHLPRVHAVAYRVLFNRADAEEVTQEVFTRLWLKAEAFDARKAGFKVWIRRMTVNLAIDRLRQRRPMVEDETVLFAIEDEGALPDMVAGDKEQALRVQAAGRELTPPQRVAVVLCYFEDYSNQEAAAKLGIQVKALEGLLVRARRVLKEKLQMVKGEHYAA